MLNIEIRFYPNILTINLAYEAKKLRDIIISNYIYAVRCSISILNPKPKRITPPRIKAILGLKK